MMVYENYTQTNIKWLEQIPSHWKLEKMKYLFYISKKENEDETPNVLSLTQRGIVERDISTNEGQLAQSYVGYNIIEIDDIVFNPMDLLSGYVSKSKFNGVISQAYTTVKPLKDLNVAYYEKFFQNWYHYGILWHLGKGVSYDNRWTLNNDTLLNIKLPVPPLEEQNKIVDFIDKKSIQIEKFIQDKTRFIELLKEQKEAVINEAVTKGIDNNVELKDSELDFFGEVPKHWEIQALKYLTKSIKTGSTPETKKGDFFEDGYFSWYTPADFNESLLLNNSKRKVNQKALNENEIKIFPENTVYMVGIGATIGKVGISNEVSSCNQQVNTIEFNQKIYAKYGTLLMSILGKEIALFANAVTLPIFNQAETKALKIMVPPLKEQKQIVEYIENELNQIDKLIEKITKEIELIKEYKTSLINEAVSGKIKVV